MNNSTFDTLQYTRRAVDAGFTREQAEFQAEELGTLLENQIVNRKILKQELSILEYRLMWKIIGCGSTIITLVQVLAHLFTV